jgi:hypothetical protein
VDEIFCSAKCEIFALWANIKEKSVRNARVSYAFNFIESFLLCKKLPSYFAKQNISYLPQGKYFIHRRWISPIPQGMDFTVKTPTGVFTYTAVVG